MQGIRSTRRVERISEMVLLILGVLLLILLTGLWAYLWVPPSPIS
jgi:hypothetical protein